jgi:hypothetical protein
MKVVKYSEFKMQGSKVKEAKYLIMAENLDAHHQDMIAKGLSESEINEGLGDLLSSLGGGFTDRLKNYAAGWLLKKLGLPEDNMFLSEWAKNIVENISFMHIGNYFGKGSCKYWANAIGKGLLETLEEKTLGLILSKGLGVDINFKSGLGGTLMGSLREALTNYINNTDFVNNLSAKLEGTICGEGTSFTNIFGGGKVSPKDIASAVSAKETNAASSAAGLGDIISGGKSGGILSLLGIQ